jgi:hypothetical protein
MEILLQFILIIAIFLPVRWFAWKFTEEWGVPDWLQYKPWVCNLCLTFWSLMGVYIALGLSFSCLYLMIGGCILAVLNAIAMYIDQRNKTIKI